MFNLGNRILFTLFTTVFLVFQSGVQAQETDAVEALDKFIHYSLVAHVELAEAFAMKLSLDDMSDEDFYKMVTETKERRERFDRAIGWALYVSELDLDERAAVLETRFEQGRTDLVRNATRLEESIELLNGTTRQKILAEKRLKEAGEYAVPALLQKLQNSTDAHTARVVRNMLVAIQRDAVLPLTIALPHLDTNSKILIIKTIGDIGYQYTLPALPTLIAISQDTQASPALRHAAEQSLSRMDLDKNMNLSDLNTVVANLFFDGQVSVIPETIGGTNLFWNWDSQLQLFPEYVPQEVFGDVMAMYFALQALKIDPANENAMSVFVSANLRRDRELAGKEDNVYGDLPYSPAFYATVFGPHVAQLVLADALEKGDTTLALEAISALAETAGATSLLSGEKPLMKAMYYPDRRVQYESALTLASTLPTETFTGSYRVVPLLASAIRTGGELFAIVIGDDSNERSTIAAFLDSNGWVVVGQGSSASEAVQAAGVVAGIDLAVVLARNADKGILAADAIASLPETTVTPTFILTSGGDVQILANAIGNRDMIETADATKSDSSKLGVIEDLLAKASGGRLSMEDQELFSNRALRVLREIALADTVLSVDDATGTLIDALKTADPDSQAVIAQTLAMIDSDLAQRALLDASLLDGDLNQRVMLLDETASSVRRWGNYAQDWQVELVLDLVENANGQLADAAARLNGALDHPNTSILTFIP